MATKYSDYNYQQDIENVLNAKIGWNNATTDEERQKQSDIANSARNRLKAYGYEDIANEISASGADATATRKILEKYSKPTTTTYPVETNNYKSSEVNRENAGSFEKHNDVYDYIMNTDPFETSEGKALMEKYDISGLKARDNAVASGGASNGGNIDSYAAANAMRQNAALVNQGKMAVLEAHQQKIDNARGILSDIGVNIDRVFNQDETAKNNNVARKSEIASVTGYAPDEWVISNNPYMNDDGTLKEEYKDIDFTTVMANAKAQGNTNAYNAAAQARWYKIMGDYGAFGQYDDGNYIVPGAQQTEAGRQFDKQIDASIAITDKEGANAINQLITKGQIDKDLMQTQANITPKELTQSELIALDDTIFAFLQNPWKDVNATEEFFPDVYKGSTSGLLTWQRAAHKLRDAGTQARIIDSLEKAGYEKKDIEQKLVRWAEQIAQQICIEEGKDPDKDGKDFEQVYNDNFYPKGKTPFIDAGRR